MIKIEEILRRKKPSHDPNVGQDIPSAPARALIALEERQQKQTAGLWIYIPMLDNAFILKIYATHGFHLVRNFAQYAIQIFFS